MHANRLHNAYGNENAAVIQELRADEQTEHAGSVVQCQPAVTTTDGGRTAAQKLQFLVAERRQLNRELLLMNPALEAS